MTKRSIRSLPPLIVLLVCTALAGIMSSQPAAAQGMGYVWANDPISPNYVPSAEYSHNSSGGPIRIRRDAVGTYSVSFHGLGGRSRAGGTVQVTAYGPGNSTCKVVNWDSARADFILRVRCFETGGAPADSQYTVLVLWPPSAPAEGAAHRTVRPDGTVENRYPDGTIKRFFPQGGWEIVPPDGPPRRVLPIEVQELKPASLPDGEESAWLERHSQGLLDIIRSLAGETARANYLQFEGTGLDLYERISKRRRTIAYLLNP